MGAIARPHKKGGIHLTDKEFRAKMKKSPAEARREVFDEYCNYVYTIVMRRLNAHCCREDIEECVSDVFIDFFRSSDRIGKRNDDLKGFISLIAERRAIDTYRRHIKDYENNTSIDEDYFAEIPSTENIVKNAERTERNALILEKVRELGEPDSTIIIQQYYYNRSPIEIGETISMTADAVRKRSLRARKRLKSMLTDADVSLGG